MLPEQKDPIKWVDVERLVLLGTRLLALVGVWGSFAGAVLIFFLEITKTYDAFLVGLKQKEAVLAKLPPAETMVIFVIEALDLFLIGIVLVYFAFGVYVLFVRPGFVTDQSTLPRWLNIQQIGQLKQVIAEVILVVLFVLFLRVALQTFHQDFSNLSLTAIAAVMLLPASIMFLGLALKIRRAASQARNFRERASSARCGKKTGLRSESTRVNAGEHSLRVEACRASPKWRSKSFKFSRMRQSLAYDIHNHFLKIENGIILSRYKEIIMQQCERVPRWKSVELIPA